MTAINGVKLKVQEAARENIRRNMAILPWRERAPAEHIQW